MKRNSRLSVYDVAVPEGQTPGFQLSEIGTDRRGQPLQIQDIEDAEFYIRSLSGTLWLVRRNVASEDHLVIALNEITNTTNGAKSLQQPQLVPKSQIALRVFERLVESGQLPRPTHDDRLWDEHLVDRYLKRIAE
jgi:hypothetical protein